MKQDTPALAQETPIKEIVSKLEKQTDDKAIQVEEEQEIVSKPETQTDDKAVQAEQEQVETGLYNVLKDDQTGAEIHSVFPHMHQLGFAITVYLDRENGEREVLVDVPAYDFNWQREYVFQESLIAEPGDTLGIECHWNNSEEYRIENGLSPSEPFDVGWGEGTVDEMCISTLYMTTP